MSKTTSEKQPIPITIVGENSIQGPAEVKVTAGDRILWHNNIAQKCTITFPCPFVHTHDACVFHVAARGSKLSREIAGDRGEYQFTVKFKKPAGGARGNPRIIIQ